MLRWKVARGTLTVYEVCAVAKAEQIFFSQHNTLPLLKCDRQMFFDKLTIKNTPLTDLVPYLQAFGFLSGRTYWL